MPGLVPGIHVLLVAIKEERRVDGRDKPGHDGMTHAASVFSTSLIQYDVPNTIASSLKL
jgi:hypothetical protein